MYPIPKAVGDLPLPESMMFLVESIRWPAGLRLSTAPLLTNAPYKFLDEVDLCLYESATRMQAELDTLRELFVAESYRVCDGATSQEQESLPWIDITRSVCIGGGADYGDDLWLLLDYRNGAREGKTEPRVVVNDLRDEWYWREVSPSFTDFALAIGLAHGTWQRGRFGAGSEYWGFNTSGPISYYFPALEADGSIGGRIYPGIRIKPPGERGEQ